MIATEMMVSIWISLGCLIPLLYLYSVSPLIRSPEIPPSRQGASSRLLAMPCSDQDFALHWDLLNPIHMVAYGSDQANQPTNLQKRCENKAWNTVIGLSEMERSISREYKRHIAIFYCKTNKGHDETLQSHLYCW